MQKQTVKIGGMTCAACATRIEKVINKLAGVKSANVNIATEKMMVEYDESITSFDEIKSKVEFIGYEVIDDNEENKVTLAIEGMTCAACAGRIEKVVGKLAGVSQVVVNITTEKATVHYDGQKVDFATIVQSIEKIGYKAKMLEENLAVDTDRLRKEEEINTLWRKFSVAIIFGVLLLYLAMGHMLGLPIPDFVNPMTNPLNFAIAQVILTVPILFVGRNFYTVGFKALFVGSPNMDSLIAIGTSAAVLFGLYSTYKISIGDVSAVSGLYFETAGVIIALILLGKYLEALSKGRTSEAIKKLMGLAPKTAILIKDGQEIEYPIEKVQIGDILLVKPGEKIPVDGEILQGNTSIDESMLTGESMPIEKQAGDKVYAASLNKNGMIQFKATKVGSDTALAQIIKLVEDAQGSKAPIAKMADIVSSYFVPIVCFIALFAGLAWYFYTQNAEFALTIFISVLVIACPCALGLATPTAIMVGTGKGAEYGILIKGGEALEVTHKINTIIFDKTGTITEGKPDVTDIVLTGEVEQQQLLQLVASAEKASEHPLGEAIVLKAQQENIEFLAVDSFEAIPGHGITAIIAQKELLIGNKKLMVENNINIESLEKTAEDLASDGKTPMYIALDNKFAGIIAVADVVKSSSAQAIAVLHKMGIEVAMITGDNQKTAEAIAKRVGIDIVLAEVLPADKAEQVKSLQAQGKKVAMVGDGINDAPALVQADIGIAIGTGTDVAIESADIVLMRSDLMDVPTAIQLSKSTIRNVKENLFWAFAYNTAGIPLAAGLFYIFGGPLLNPMFAAAAMSFSSISVLLNALRLKRFKPYTAK